MSVSLSKRVLFSIIFILLHVLMFAEERTEYYRSNYNALLLLKIPPREVKNYDYVVKEVYLDEVLRSRILYKKDKIEKRWDYYYIEDRLSEEIYYKNGRVEEQYLYNEAGHKTNQKEYRNGKLAINTDYVYNTDGLVEKEIVKDLLLSRTNKVNYRYDGDFRIKQIIREEDDGKVIYWDAFFDRKGIVSKEYYTIDNEIYTFFYGDGGQELGGKVIEKVMVEVVEEQTEGSEESQSVAEESSSAEVAPESEKPKKMRLEERLKREWEIKYSGDGKKYFKDEKNIPLNKRTKSWYDNSGRETKVEYYQNGDLVRIEEKVYREDGILLQYREVVGLSVKVWHYKYEGATMVETYYYESGKRKSKEEYLSGGNRRLTTYGANDVNILQNFDSNGNLIDETILFE